MMMVVVTMAMAGRGKGRTAHHEQQSKNKKLSHGENRSMIQAARTLPAPTQVTASRAGPICLIENRQAKNPEDPGRRTLKWQ
jgi:hypothetical protein